MTSPTAHAKSLSGQAGNIGRACDLEGDGARIRGPAPLRRSMGAATDTLTAMAFTSRLCGLPGQVLKGAVGKVIVPGSWDFRRKAGDGMATAVPGKSPARPMRHTR